MKVIITQLNVPPPIPAAVVSGIVAQPGGQALATPLAASVNIVSVVASGTGVMLQILATRQQAIFNTSGNPLLIYPPENTLIQGTALNVAITLPAGGFVWFVFDGTQTWLIAFGSGGGGGGGSVNNGGTLDFSQSSNSGLIGVL